MDLTIERERVSSPSHAGASVSGLAALPSLKAACNALLVHYMSLSPDDYSLLLAERHIALLELLIISIKPPPPVRE